MSTAGQQLTTVRPATADCRFPIASGDGANNPRSTAWGFFKTVEKKWAGAADQARDVSWWIHGLHGRARLADARFFRGGSSICTRPAARTAGVVVAACMTLVLHICWSSSLCGRFRDPCRCTASIRDPLHGTAHLFGLSLRSRRSALGTAGRNAFQWRGQERVRSPCESLSSAHDMGVRRDGSGCGDRGRCPTTSLFG